MVWNMWSQNKKRMGIAIFSILFLVSCSKKQAFTTEGDDGYEFEEVPEQISDSYPDPASTGNTYYSPSLSSQEELVVYGVPSNQVVATTLQQSGTVTLVKIGTIYSLQEDPQDSLCLRINDPRFAEFFSPTGASSMLNGQATHPPRIYAWNGVSLSARGYFTMIPGLSQYFRHPSQLCFSSQY